MALKKEIWLQLCQEVKTSEKQTKSVIMSMLQKAQNRMIRTVTGTWQKDRVRIEDLLEKTNILSVNQTAAQIKQLEMWKVAKQENYPVKIESVEQNTNGRSTRWSKDERFKEKPKTKWP